MEITRMELGEGLVLYYSQQSAEDISVIASLGAGIIYEPESQRGISHLVEHMLYRGTARRPTEKGIMRELELMGNNWQGYTSEMDISLEMRVVPEDFGQALDIMSDLIFCARMKHSDFQKERKVVLEERNDNLDDPVRFTLEELDKHIWKGCPFESPISGSDESVSAIKLGELKEFYSRIAIPQNITLFVVGPDEIAGYGKLLENYFCRHSKAEGFAAPAIKLPENNSEDIVLERELNSVQFAVGGVAAPGCGRDYYALLTLRDMLRRELVENVRIRKGLVYDAGVYYSKNKHYGDIVAYGSCSMKNYRAVKGLMLDKIGDYFAGKISEELLDNTKMKIEKALRLSCTSTMDWAEAMHTFNNIRSAEEYPLQNERIKGVTIEQVRAAAGEYLNPDKLFSISVGRF